MPNNSQTQSNSVAVESTYVFDTNKISAEEYKQLCEILKLNNVTDQKLIDFLVLRDTGRSHTVKNFIFSRNWLKHFGFNDQQITQIALDKDKGLATIKALIDYLPVLTDKKYGFNLKQIFAMASNQHDGAGCPLKAVFEHFEVLQRLGLSIEKMTDLASGKNGAMCINLISIGQDLLLHYKPELKLETMINIVKKTSDGDSGDQHLSLLFDALKEESKRLNQIKINGYNQEAVNSNVSEKAPNSKRQIKINGYYNQEAVSLDVSEKAPNSKRQKKIDVSIRKKIESLAKQTADNEQATLAMLQSVLPNQVLELDQNQLIHYYFIVENEIGKKLNGEYSEYNERCGISYVRKAPDNSTTYQVVVNNKYLQWKKDAIVLQVEILKILAATLPYPKDPRDPNAFAYNPIAEAYFTVLQGELGRKLSEGNEWSRYKKVCGIICVNRKSEKVDRNIYEMFIDKEKYLEFVGTIIETYALSRTQQLDSLLSAQDSSHRQPNTSTNTSNFFAARRPIIDLTEQDEYNQSENSRISQPAFK